GRWRTGSVEAIRAIAVITTMYAKPSESQSRSSVFGAGVKLPKLSPNSVSLASVPSGQAMKKNPVMAKPIANRRRLRTTNRSAFSPVIARRILTGRLANSSPTYDPAMIDREQVLHVAKLARLRLDEAEVERMSGELSGILEHVDRISALDLDDVEPTSHVVDLENVLRPDEPRPSWPKDVVLEQAPDPADGAFRVPSPQAE